MFTELQKYLARPSLYERTETKFWDDPYISTQMLKWHLDPESDAASHRPEKIDKAVEWMASLLPENARLLDIGCGPGLYVKRLAERGLRVTGVDFSENSINYARGQDGKSEYILQNYLSMEFDGLFDAAIMISCDFGALVPEERRNLLSRVHRALKPGGLFLFDINTPQYLAGEKDRKYWAEHPNGGLLSPNPHICLYADYLYGEDVKGHRTVLFEESGVRCFNLWYCEFTKESIVREVSPFGFIVAEMYGDTAGSEYKEGSKVICPAFKKV